MSLSWLPYCTARMQQEKWSGGDGAGRHSPRRLELGNRQAFLVAVPALRGQWPLLSLFCACGMWLRARCCYPLHI